MVNNRMSYVQGPPNMSFNQLFLAYFQNRKGIMILHLDRGRGYTIYQTDMGFILEIWTIDLEKTDWRDWKQEGIFLEICKYSPVKTIEDAQALLR